MKSSRYLRDRLGFSFSENKYIALGLMSESASVARDVCYFGELRKKRRLSLSLSLFLSLLCLKLVFFIIIIIIIYNLISFVMELFV